MSHCGRRASKSCSDETPAGQFFQRMGGVRMSGRARWQESGCFPQCRLMVPFLSISVQCMYFYFSMLLKELNQGLQENFWFLGKSIQTGNIRTNIPKPKFAVKKCNCMFPVVNVEGRNGAPWLEAPVAWLVGVRAGHCMCTVEGCVHGGGVHGGVCTVEGAGGGVHGGGGGVHDGVCALWGVHGGVCMYGGVCTVGVHGGVCTRGGGRHCEGVHGGGMHGGGVYSGVGPELPEAASSDLPLKHLCFYLSF